MKDERGPGSKAVVALAFVILFGRTAMGKYVYGHLVTRENWAFVARFCFLSETGSFEYNVEYDEDRYGTVNILLYYDSQNQWPSVYKSNKTCRQKESVLNVEQNQIVNLTVENGCTKKKFRTNERKSGGGGKNSGTVSCNDAKRFRSSRERWWFIAFSNCNSSKGLNVRYKFLMTNAPPGEYWHEHLSADEFYVLPILMTFSVLYMLMILSIVMCAVELKSRQFLHATYKLFAVSVGLQEAGVMCQSVAYVRYALDGTGHPKMKYFGQTCEAASEICFLVLLLLLAKGYTVTRGRLRIGSSIKLTVFTCLYVLCFSCLLIYEKEYFDPGEVLYLYDCPPGYGVMVLRVIAWWMFIYSTVFTLKHYPEKVTFYYPFNIIGTLWFVAGPVVVLAANTQIDKWVRESVVCGAFHAIAFGGHLLFLILTLPSKANKNFPYHVRTNQIGMMEITGISGNSTIFQFGHHPYAPGGAAGLREVPFELFSVSRHLDPRENSLFLDSQPYPHQFGPKYSQTILLPIAVKNFAEEPSPFSSSGNGTPETVEDGQPTGNELAVAETVDAILAKDKKIYTADFADDSHPSAPAEECDGSPKSAADADSRLSIEHLTAMFAVDGKKKSGFPA